MKNIFAFFAIALTGIFATGLVACSDPEPKDGNIAVTPLTVEFDAEGGTQTIDVTGDNWTATESDEWIEVESAEGKITVTVGANTAEGERTGSITVKNSADTKVVAVKQAGAAVADPALEVNPEELPFTADGSTETVNVTSELDWTATANEEWIKVEESEESFTVTVGVNESTDPRTGSITVDNGENTKTVTVSQDAAEEQGIRLNVAGIKTTVAPNADGDGKDLWAFNIYEDGIVVSDDGMLESWTTGQYIYLEARVNEGTPFTELPQGTYTFEGSNFSITPGFFGPMNMVFGSLYKSYVDGALDSTLPLTGGEMTISKDGDNYTIIIDMVEESGTAVKMEYSGPVNIFAFI